MTVSVGRPNPYNSDLALANRTAAIYREGRLVRLDGSAVAPPQELAHDTLRGLVLSRQFSCVGGMSAIRRNRYHFAFYDHDLGSARSTAGLAHDLFTFTGEPRREREEFGTFIACFTGPTSLDERGFEQRLWQQLQQLHQVDQDPWAAGVSADPADPAFSFSFAGQAFYVLGLHPAAGRYARRFTWATLIFNLHEQFEELRQDGRFERMRDTIRDRERALQGSTLSTLADFGESSEARQYAGREVEPDWRCPFRPKGR